MTRRLGLFITVAAVVALGLTAFTTVASAEEGGNPLVLLGKGASFPIPFSFTGGSGRFTSAAGVIECRQYQKSGEINSARTGTVLAQLSECTSSGVACKSAGDAAGVVLVKGNITIVALLNAGVLGLGIATTLPTNLVLKCGTLTIEIKGTIIGVLEGVESGHFYPAGTVKSLTFGESGTKQQYETCDLPKEFCEGKTYRLEAEFGTGFKPAVLAVHGEGSMKQELAADF